MTTAVHTPGPGSRLDWAVRDGLQMTRRNLVRLSRAPDQVVFALLSPIMFTLLFRYVFGGAIEGTGPVSYVDYLIPGIAVQTALFAASNTGFALATDRGAGFTDRLRSLPMARSAVLTGRVLADTLNNAMQVTIIVVVGVLVGFRPDNLGGLLLGVLLLLAFALAVCFVFAIVGLSVTTVEAVNAATFPVLFPLTFASSAFVPTATMPGWLQAFAENQPVTVLINAMRSLVLGDVPPEVREQLFAGHSTSSLVLQSLAWTLVIGTVGAYFAVRKYNAESR